MLLVAEGLIKSALIKNFQKFEVKSLLLVKCDKSATFIKY